MPLPTVEELAAELRAYVDAPANQLTYITSCVEEAMDFIKGKVGVSSTVVNLDGYVTPVETVPISQPMFKREIIELGSDLFYRRQARNGIVGVNSMDGSPVRQARDPFAASEARLAHLVGPAIA